MWMLSLENGTLTNYPMAATGCSNVNPFVRWCFWLLVIQISYSIFVRTLTFYGIDASFWRYSIFVSRLFLTPLILDILLFFSINKWTIIHIFYISFSMINNVYPILNKKILYINDVVECSEMSLAIATRTSVWAHKLTMFFSLKIQLVPKGQKILKQVNNIQWGRFKGILFF